MHKFFQFHFLRCLIPQSQVEMHLPALIGMVMQVTQPKAMNHSHLNCPFFLIVILCNLTVLTPTCNLCSGERSFTPSLNIRPIPTYKLAREKPKKTVKLDQKISMKILFHFPPVCPVNNNRLIQQQPAKTSVSPRSSLMGTFRTEERLQLSGRNSILMAQTNVYIINPVVMGFQIQICPILRVFWSILVKCCVHLPTSSSKTQMPLQEKTILLKY